MRARMSCGAVSYTHLGLVDPPGPRERLAVIDGDLHKRAGHRRRELGVDDLLARVLVASSQLDAREQQVSRAARVCRQRCLLYTSRCV